MGVYLMIGLSRRKDKKTDENDQRATISSKPKILLIDFPDEISEELRSKGLNATTGTFGSPYRVEVSRNVYHLQDVLIYQIFLNSR